MSRAFKIIFAILMTPPLTFMIYMAALVALIGLIPFGILYCPFWVFNNIMDKHAEEETN
jgi:hypothetical protein